MNPKSLASKIRISRDNFPPQKEPASGSTRARRDRGANNKRLPRVEDAPVAFDVPIARHNSEAHETPETTRDGKGVLKVVSRGQLPGCLPFGFTIDSLLSRQEFCIWRRVSLEWLKPRVKMLPGVVMESQKVWGIHPRSYIEKSLKGTR